MVPLLPFRHLFSAIVVLLVVSFAASSTFADTKHRRYRTRTVRSFSAPLQPFTVGSPRIASRLRVAYYSPRSIPRAPVMEEDRNEEVGPAPSVESRGSRPTVSGNRAVIRGGVAYAPANAPERVKSAIWAVNTIRRKPYHWGGGHGSFNDSGYDCSGTVSFALHHAGALGSPLGSSDLIRYGERGRGKWITVYSRRGHTFAVIAGLRLDTTDFRSGGDVGPRWHNDMRSLGGFQARHPVGL